MAKRARKTYSDEQRGKIIQTAQAENLTALDVQKRFGVTPVTYYSWRKKLGLKGPRGRKPGSGKIRPAASFSGGNDLTAQVRAGVQAKVREVLPGIVREEVARYLDSLLGAGTMPKRRGRPPKNA
jgi:transposase-like protein